MSPHKEPAQDDYSFSFDNRVGGTPITTEDDGPYSVSEHLLWAPEK